MNLNQFSTRIRQIGRTIEAESLRVKKDVALLVDQAVVYSTPVDTGRARSNWIVELNSPADDTIEPLDTSGASALAHGESKITQARQGDVIHITNNLDYISRLNDGYSAQAPAGFVEQAVQIAVNAVRRARVVR